MVIGTARPGCVVADCTGQAGVRGRRHGRALARYAGAALGVAGALLMAGALACAPSSTDADKLPPNVPDPASVQNERGALAFYRQVVTLMLPQAVTRVMAEGGVLTDELAALELPVGQGGPWTGWDSRTTTTLPDNAESYRRLHYLRGQAREARGFLVSYAVTPDSTDTYNERDLRAHLYVAEAYADVFLADLYCSGIPLSTVDFGGDYTLTPGLPTDTVYARAVGLFDSALALVQDSAAVLQPLAAVGKGRALLALGRYAEAAAAVAGVSDGYQYRVTDDGSLDGGEQNFGVPLLQAFAADRTEFRGATPVMADREGGTGLPYRSAGDPRTAVTELGIDVRGRTVYFPAKYAPSGPLELPLASGIEARLIEAEVALQAASSDWLTILNALRTDGTFHEEPTPDETDDPAATDTIWHPGTGGTAGLAPLVDPGAAQARVDLLFQERAFWLYLTAHRQGDLRRLLRRYAALGYVSTEVYPKTGGPYPGGRGVYGDAIVAEVPETERQLNPKYTGCLHRNA